MNETQLASYFKDYNDYQSESPLLKYIITMFATQEKEQKLADLSQKSKLFHTIVKKAFKAYLVDFCDKNQIISAGKPAKILQNRPMALVTVLYWMADKQLINIKHANCRVG